MSTERPSVSVFQQKSHHRGRHIEAAEQETLQCLTENVSTLQSAAAELSEVRDELDASKRERSSLQTKIVQLTTALKSILATKVSLNCSLFYCLVKIVVIVIFLFAVASGT